MEFRKTKTWASIRAIYWIVVFCTAAFFYRLIVSTLF